MAERAMHGIHLIAACAGSWGAAKQNQANHAGDDDPAELDPCSRLQQNPKGENHGDADAQRIGAKALRHAPYSLRHHGHRHQFEAMPNPQRHAHARVIQHIREPPHQQCRRQCEAQPRGETARQACAQQADTDTHPATGRARQELTHRHQIGVGMLAQPASARDKLLPKIPQMRNWSAERRQAQSKKHLKNRPSGGALS